MPVKFGIFGKILYICRLKIRKERKERIIRKGAGVVELARLESE